MAGIIQINTALTYNWIVFLKSTIVFALEQTFLQLSDEKTFVFLQLALGFVH